MALRDYLKAPATAIPAIPATQEPRIARIARIAVASSPIQAPSEPLPLDALAEVRQLVEEIALHAPSYWTPADVEEAVSVAATTDVCEALGTFREIAAHYRRLH